MPTIKDIARECGVSANTVSSVLNNKPGEVSAATRARVLEAVRRLGYRPSAAARRMVGKRANTLGIADRYSLSPPSEPYKTQILEPIIQTARAGRWDVLYYSGHSGDDLSGGFPAFLDGRCDGLVCFTGSLPPGEVQAILRAGLPVVFIGDPSGVAVTEQRGAVIDVDNETGGHLGVSHLTRLGHTRIAMIEGGGVAGNAGRVAGYRRALAEASLPVDESFIVPTVAWGDAGYQQALSLLSRPVAERPTAVFCFNDVLALGLLRAAREVGVACPEELSVVGFDDVYAAAVSAPPLTTVRQPLVQIGQRAVEILIAIIEERLPPNYREIAHPELIVRHSTAPPCGGQAPP